MNREDFCFEEWFESIRLMVLDATGVNFRDTDSVQQEYIDGRSACDVAEDIIVEYGGEPLDD